MCVQVAVGIDQTSASRSNRAARPSITPTWEQQQPPSTSGRSGSASASASSAQQRLLGDNGHLRPRGAATAPRRHRLAPAAPRPRDADEPGAELAAARMALVTRTDATAVKVPHFGHFARRTLIDSCRSNVHVLGLDAHADALVEAGRVGRVLGVDAEGARGPTHAA